MFLILIISETYIVISVKYILYPKISEVIMIYDDKKFIGNVIRNARKSAGFTQCQLAEEIGMSEKNLGNIENGKQFPQVNNFLHIIEFLNIPLENFGVKKELIFDNTTQKLLNVILSADSKNINTYCEIFELIKSVSK